MGDKILVRFKDAGKWADNPADPIFEVEAGDELEVSANLANILVESKKGKIIKKKVKPVEPEKPTLVEGEACELEDGTKGAIKDGACVADEVIVTNSEEDEDELPKEGDECELENGKKGVIKKGKCVKKGILG